MEKLRAENGAKYCRDARAGVNARAGGSLAAGTGPLNRDRPGPCIRQRPDGWWSYGAAAHNGRKARPPKAARRLSGAARGRTRPRIDAGRDLG
jgi:hypothetical protein